MDVGLRERKRLATRRAIQWAGLEIAKEDGLDRATVDAIAERANISPRTFFNYFPTRDASLIGEIPGTPSREELGLDASDSIIERLLEYIIQAMSPSAPDRELSRLRREVLRSYPVLFAQRMVQMQEIELTLAGLVAEHMIDSGEADGPELRHKAHLTALMATAAARSAWFRWAASEETPEEYTEDIRASFAMLGEIVSS
ncbi:TetR family transcriptional regulator [Humidisolicoccus flavus]|uniref:TetR family transcriptional regulator n=1 Tax=Humidisolicoccus flavus TaxID=3111414 RepID=UPI0032498A68